MVNLQVVKSAFFTSPELRSKMDRMSRSALSKIGAYVRQRARSSIRPRKAISLPGQPPSSHVGTLKKLIFFSYDSVQKDVVIGPILFGRRRNVPHSLEWGGASTVGRKNKPVTIRPRPFMKPALAAELPAAAQKFKDMLR